MNFVAVVDCGFIQKCIFSFMFRLFSSIFSCLSFILTFYTTIFHFILITPQPPISSPPPAFKKYLPPVARSVSRQNFQKTMEPLTSKPAAKSWTYITSMANRMVPKRWNFGAATSQYWRDNLPHKQKKLDNLTGKNGSNDSKLPMLKIKTQVKIEDSKVRAVEDSFKREGKIVSNSFLRRKCSQLLSCYATSKTCRVAFLSTNCSNIM